MGLLDQFTQAVDARKRYYGNIVRGLLDNPQALMEQLRAQNAENVREQSRSVQDARSVMPGIAEPAKQAAFDEAMNVGLLGLTAYHGSPHSFDKFDMSKIGTGEGAQAFGHGLYFAESPNVAKSYMTAGSSVVPQDVKYMGKNADQWYTHFAKRMDRNPNDEEAKAATYFWEHVASRQHPQAAINNALSDPSWPALYNYAKNMDVSKFTGTPPANLYKVDIPDEAVAKMLDWDKPLSQQPEAVRKAFQELGFDTETVKYKTPEEWHKAAYKYLSGKDAVRLVNTDLTAAEDIYAARRAWNKGPDEFMAHLESNPWLRAVLTKAKGGDKPGSAAYGALSDQMGGFGAYVGQGGGQIAAAKKLRELGVPGIRYLDAGSRGKGGTSNFVLFDDSLPKIIGRE